MKTPQEGGPPEEKDLLFSSGYSSSLPLSIEKRTKMNISSVELANSYTLKVHDKESYLADS